MAAEQRNKVVSKLHAILKPYMLRRLKSGEQGDRRSALWSKWSSLISSSNGDSSLCNSCNATSVCCVLLVQLASLLPVQVVLHMIALFLQHPPIVFAGLHAVWGLEKMPLMQRQRHLPRKTFVTLATSP